MIDGNKSLNDLSDEARATAVAHGFTEATIPEDVALICSEASEALEDHRAGEAAAVVWYETKRSEKSTDFDGAVTTVTSVTRHKSFVGEFDTLRKPCGIPSEMADIIIRVLHFCGKHEIDIDRAVREKMAYNETRPYKNGGKVI